MANEPPLYGYPGTLSPIQKMLDELGNRVTEVTATVEETARSAAEESVGPAIQAAIQEGQIASAAEEVGARPAGDVPQGESTGKPSTFPPSAHGHAWGDITGDGE